MSDRRRNGVREFVGGHQLTCYFVLSYALTWLAWAPFVLSSNGLGLLDFRIPAMFGGATTLGVMPGAYLGPIFSAFAVTALASGRAGLRTWARRLLRWRVRWVWYVLVLLGVPAVLVVSTLPLPGALAAIRLPALGVLLSYLPMLLMQLLTTGLAEEPGWRDFALPQLQDRHGPLVGTLILAPLWGAWHLPLFLTEWAGWPNVDPLLVAEFFGSVVPLSITMTWLFNRTGQSLPIVMLFHASINNFSSVAWEPLFPTLDPFHGSLVALFIASVLMAAICLVATRGRLGYRGAASSPTIAAASRRSGTARRAPGSGL